MITQERTMEESVSQLDTYMRTYGTQYKYEEYETKTYVDDVLYGLGASLSDGYLFAGGYKQFKKDLLEYLGGNDSE